MDAFLLKLSSITNLINPILIFLLLLTMIMFLFFIKDKINEFLIYTKKIAICLQQIASKNNK